MKSFVSARMPDYWLEELGKYFEVDYYDWSAHGLLDEADFEERAKDSHVIVVESDKMSRGLIERASQLFAIVDFRGTVINVDIEAANEHGVAIINTPGRNADAVADLTIALIIMASRHVLPSIQYLKEGLWAEKGRYWMYTTCQGHDLPNKTVGLIGLGYIGRLVAKRLSGFDVEILGYDPYINKANLAGLNVNLVSLEELLERSDFVSFHLPLNDQTKGTFGKKQFSLMKKNAYLINTSRAAVIHEPDFLDALQQGKIAGAAVDVYPEEPITTDYPLLNLPNVICTPHIGGASLDVISHQSRIGISALVEFLQGSTPDNIINPQSLEKARAKMQEISV